MTPDTTVHFYTEHYRSLYTNAGASVLFETQHHKGQQFCEVLSQLGDNLVVYEVGCGCGGALKAFQEAGHTVAGCDFDTDYLEYGRSHGLELIEGGADELLKQRGHTADVVLLTHVAEHFLDLRREFALVMDVITPGGVLLAEVPGLRSISTDYRGDILLYLQNAHTYHFTAATFRYVLSCVGFDVLAADEQVVALAQRPLSSNTGQEPAIAQGEAMATLNYLNEVESAWQAANATGR